MLWDLKEGKRLYSLDAGEIIHSLVFSPNRYWLCAATTAGIKVRWRGGGFVSSPLFFFVLLWQFFILFRFTFHDVRVACVLVEILMGTRVVVFGYFMYDFSNFWKSLLFLNVETLALNRDRSGTWSLRWSSTSSDPTSPSSLPPPSCRTARASAGPTTEASCTPGEFCCMCWVS